MMRLRNPIGQTGTRAPRRRVGRQLSTVVAAASLMAGGLSVPPAAAASGDLDASFGNSGLGTIDFGPGLDEGSAVTLQKDGRIVIAGATDVDQTPPADGAQIGPINLDFALTRINPNGTVDTSWGSGGKTVTGFGSQSDAAFAVAVQADGKVVAAGSTIVDAAGTDAKFALARYLSDGSLDPNFGNGGRVETDFTPKVDGIEDIAIQDDGRIVAVGTSNCPPGIGGCTGADVALARYNTDGSLDGSFGTGGKLTTNLGGGDSAKAVALQGDGMIIIGGLTTSLGDPSFALARYTPSGGLDTSFGNGGKVVTPFVAGRTDFINDVAVQADGRIVAGGSANKGAGLDDSFALARYNYNGSLDTGFGDGGKVMTDIGARGDGINALALLGDGRIVAAGLSADDVATSPPTRFAVAQYLGDGSLDTGFSGDGKTTIAIGSSQDEATGVAVQSDGKIVLGGLSPVGGEDRRFAVARLEGDGKPLIVPGTTGPGTGSAGYWMVASDGGIFAFGDAAFKGSTGALRLARPIVGMAPTRSGQGYWLVASDGGIFAFGDAAFFGSTGALRLAQPIVGMAASPSGRGYWLVAADGGIFAFGDAPFKGSTGALRLNKPIVGMAATASGQGYWLVASDGGIFAFGDAVFKGSTGAITLNKPIVGATPTRSGQGYWLVASDGGIFAFGDAAFKGSTGALRLAQPIVGMTATKTGGGYWMVASDGGIFAFGDAQFLGSTGALRLAKPIVGMAAL